MEVVTEGKTYLSPEYKLLAFFEESRNRWKRKALQRKQDIRRLEKRVASLEASRRMWKEKAQAQRSNVDLYDDDRKEKRIRV
jgi:hypothetical protein